MTTLLRALSPFAIALFICLPGKTAQACDLKNCPHHAKGAKSCECPCGDSKDGKKAHACSAGHCKKMKCTDKGCCQHQHKKGGGEPNSPTQSSDEQAHAS
jgi:hypothetical protein